MVLTDMIPDPDLLEETRGSGVRLLWGLDDLVSRLADLPEGDQVQKQLGKTLIAQEVEKLSRRLLPRDRPYAAGGDADGEGRTGHGPGRR